jgi:hypothetical protein
MVPAMSLELAGILAAAVVAALAAGWWRTRARAAVVVSAEPDAALLSSAAALRRLGARITRYDGEGGTLEARVRESSAIVRVRTDPGGDGTTRVRLEGDPRAGRVIRQFRRALSA